MPVPGQWTGVFFEATSDDSRNIFDYVTVSYAGQPVCWLSTCYYSTGIGVYDASPILQHTTIAYSAGDGLWVGNTHLALGQDRFEQNAGHGVFVRSTTLTLTNSLLSQNGSDGLEVFADGIVLTPTITGNTIISNTGQAIYIHYANGAGLPIASGNSMTGNGGFDGVGVGGTQGYSMTWPTVEALSRAVVSDLTIMPGVELTVEPGAEMRFSSHTGLFVSGAVRAVGTVTQPITFTTTSAMPVPGQWTGLFFETSSADSWNVLDYVSINYAGQAVCWLSTCYYHTGIGVYDAAPTIQHTTVAYSAGDGLWAWTANLTLDQDTFAQNAGSGVFAKSTTLTLSNSALSQNGGDGVQIVADGLILTPTITGNTIVNNTGQAIYLNYVNGAGLPIASGNTTLGNNGFDGVGIGGTLGFSMVWPADVALQRAIVANLIINPQVELTMEPGSEMRFSSHTGLFVAGAVRAIGMVTQPISFTSTSVLPAPGQWTGLFFEASSDDNRNMLDYVTVSNAGQAVCWLSTCYYSTGIGVYDASPIIQHTTVAHSAGDGLWAWTANLILNHDTFEQNVGNGVSVKSTALTLNDSHLSQNGSNGLEVIAAGSMLTPTLTDNTIISNTGQAIYLNYLNGAGLPIASNNTLTDNGGFNGVGIGGTLGYSMTWPADETLPRAIVSNLVINPDVELMVEPRGEIRFGDHTGLFVAGAVRAVGTVTQPITFTSALMSPAPGQWSGVFFEASSDDSRNRLDYVTISYAGQALCWLSTCYYNIGLGVYDATPTIQHTTVTHSAGDGLWALDASLTLSQDTFEHNAGNGVTAKNSTLQIDDGLLRDNGADGIQVLSSQVTVENCQLIGNAVFGLENVSAVPSIQARYNWWGHPSGPYNASTNPNGQGSRVSDNVVYDPWLVTSGVRTPISLALDQVLTGTVAPQGYVDYRLNVQPGQNMLVEVTPDQSTASLWLFSRFDSLADWSHFDSRVQTVASSAHYDLPVVSSSDSPLYLSLYGHAVPAAGGQYTLTAHLVGKTLVAVTPDTAGNAGQATLDVSGLPFVEGLQIQLRATGRPSLSADQVMRQSATHLLAHFNLKNVITGTYDVVAHWPDGGEASLPGAFSIMPGSGAPPGGSPQRPQSDPGRARV